MGLLKRLWNDDSGLVLSAELVTISTLGVLGATAGLSVAVTSVNNELAEVAQAIRSLNQSYCFTGFSGQGCCTNGYSVVPTTHAARANASVWRAGSSYIQSDVQASLAELELSRVKTERAAEPRHNASKLPAADPTGLPRKKQRDK